MFAGFDDTMAPPGGAPQLRLGQRELESLLPSFRPSGEAGLSAEEWASKMARKLTALGVQDKQALVLAGMKLRGAARKWYEELDEDYETWDEFKEKLIEHFPKDVSQRKIKEGLERRKRSNESVEDYVYEKMGLAKRGRYDESHLREYVIDGIPDANNRKILSHAKYTTIPELIAGIKLVLNDDRKTRVRESSRRSRSPRKRSPKRSPKRRLDRSRSDRGKRQNDDGENSRKRDEHGKSGQKKKDDNFGQKRDGKGKRTKKCFLCKSTDHLIAKCPKNPDFRVRLVEKQATGHKSRKTLQKDCCVNGKKLCATIDTGSDLCLMAQSTAVQLGIVPKGPQVLFRVYGGETHKTVGVAEAQIQLDGVDRKMEIHIVPDTLQDFPLLIGRNFTDSPGIIGIMKDGEIELISRDCDAKKPKKRRPITLDDMNLGDVAEDEDARSLLDLVNNYRDCFALSNKELGRTSTVTMKITLKEDKIIRYGPYRIPLHLQGEVDKALAEYDECGITEDSQSEFASPMVIIKKPDGSLRICVDYRLVNSVIVKEYHPLPSVEEQLHRLYGSSVFIVADMLMGYHQIPLDPESRKYTSFVTPDQQKQFTCVPFGLANSPAVFLRLMDKVMAPLKGEKIIWFVDDIVVHAESGKECLVIFEKLLQELRKHGLTLKVKKCNFLASRITYLGHEVDGKHMSPGKGKTLAVEKFPQPTTQTKVRQFLGLSGFFRRFIERYAEISLPLRNLIRKNVTFKWDYETDESFEQLKKRLVSKPVLVLYSPTAEHELHCDASQEGLAGVLLQKEQHEDSYKPVAFFSRATTASEKKFHSYELEALAIVESMERFRYFLLGKSFTVVTDCNSLIQAQKSRHIIPRIARWWMRIQNYDFSIKHRPGTMMCHVDSLSRNPYEISEEKEIPQVLMLGIESEDWVVTFQQNDPYVKKIRDVLEQEDKNEEVTDEMKQIRREYELEEGRVYRKTEQGNKFVVPTGLRHYVLKHAHDGAGHPAEDRTIKNVEKFYWFQKLRPTVKTYVAGCVHCLMHKRGKDESRFTWHVVEKTPIPFHTVHLDFAGPYPKVGSKAHIFGLVDAFTRFTILRAVSGPTGKVVKQILAELSQYFGISRVIVTDNGKAFTSEMFKAFCRDHDIQHSPVSVHTPRANGAIERVFRVVNESLRCLSEEEDGKDWVRNLPRVQWAINNHENRVTGESPHRLLLGYHPRNVMGNVLLNAVLDDLYSKAADPEELEQIRQIALANMTKHQYKEADKHNKKVVPPSKYNKGDLVLLRYDPPATGGSRKMMPRYRGPYVVDSVDQYDRYTIKDTQATQISSRPFKSRYPANELKACGIAADLEENDCVLDEESEEEKD